MSFSWGCDVVRRIALDRVAGRVTKPLTMAPLRSRCPCDVHRGAGLRADRRRSGPENAAGACAELARGNDRAAARRSSSSSPRRYTYREIGRAIGMSHGGVRLVEQRALVKLRKALRALGGEP